ncbi:MAG TPA: hypothetical protein H9694_00890 [Firmicutes bacterium]|nr:hypothetical protein [Bacillota bacterium]
MPELHPFPSSSAFCAACRPTEAEIATIKARKTWKLPEILVFPFSDNDPLCYNKKRTFSASRFFFDLFSTCFKILGVHFKKEWINRVMPFSFGAKNGSYIGPTSMPL